MSNCLLTNRKDSSASRLDCARSPRGLRPVVMSVLALVIFCLTLQAQPALQNAILNDRGLDLRQQERADSFAEVEGIEAGPVRIAAVASYSLEFNDNVRYSEDDPSGDFIQTPSVTLSIAAPISQRSQLVFQIGIGYNIYWHNEDLSQFTIAPGSELAYDVEVKDFLISLFNRFGYTSDVSTAPDLANQSQFPRLENLIGTQIAWAPDRFLVAGGYSFGILRTTDDAFDYVNSDTHLPFLRAGYIFANDSANSGLEFSATFTDYQSNINSDSTIVSFGPYLDWQLSDSIQAAARGGFLYSVNSLTLLPEDSFDANSFYLGLSARQELTAFISHSLVIDHGLRPSVQQGAAFTEETSVAYQVSWAFIDPASLGVNLGYIHGQQTIAAGLNPSETYDQWRMGLGLAYELTPRLSTNLDYDYLMRDSNLAGRSYAQNRVTLGLSYLFD